MYGHPAQNKIKTYQPEVAIAACRFSLSSTGAIQLTPAGSFSAKDGRPHVAGQWFITDETAPKILAKLKARQDQMVIDYEHQTLNAEKNGQPAPAAGWINGADIEWRSGEGFFVTPEWTDAAKSKIDTKEYKYFSPVMVFNKLTGEVYDIIMGAITNYAAIDGMDELQAQAAAKFSFQLITQPQEENSMNAEQIRALLGLEKDASDEQVQVALTALVKKDKDSEVAIAAAKAETPDDAMAIIKSMQTDLAALTAKNDSDEVNAIVETALSDGKLLPVQKDWATSLGQTDMVALKGFIDKAPKIAALNGDQTKGKTPEGEEGNELNDTDLAVCKGMGIDPEDYKKTLAEDK